MKKIIVLIFLSVIAFTMNAQDKYFTKTGTITFDATSAGSPEKIQGTNKSVTCVLDSKTGNIQFLVLMTGFEFERALMQEHFNENYVESPKFPKSDFKGQITDNASVNYTKDGTYKVTVKGKLTLHGETKDVQTTGTITVKSGKINATADFTVLLSDYKISIPGVVADKVAKSATIKVNCSLEPLK